MPGRYQFSLPERRSRDGWFRIGSIDITTTALLVLTGIASMFWYAIDKESLSELIFAGVLVRDGDLWRVLTWPLVTRPDVFSVITLAFFWFVGHQIEDRIGRRRFTVLILAMTVIPASLVTMLRFESSQGVYSLNLLALALLVVFALDNPSATSFFGIPIWVFAAVYVGVMMLQYIGDGMYESLVMGIGVILIALGGARQYGMLNDFSFIPRMASSSVKKSRPPKAPRQKGGAQVVAGPWASPMPKHSPADEAELNHLLDKISGGGIDSLSRNEKARLNELSKKLRGS